jgi:metal-responsive CopG/Arc/MetJ family transcriptional regulator
MKELTRKSSGVVFESDVLTFIDQLTSEQQRSRSFIINQIIRHYAVQRQRANGGTSVDATNLPIKAIQF